MMLKWLFLLLYENDKAKEKKNEKKAPTSHAFFSILSVKREEELLL
jgi:hypothetical protein